MSNNKAQLISVFKGLDRREKGGKGGFCVAENVCADEYPCICTTKGHKKITPVDEKGNPITNIRAVICPDDGFSELFCGVCGTDFYYKGKKIPFFGDAEIPSDGRIELLKMNGNIIICCYNNFEQRTMLYYNFCGYALDKRKISKDYVVRMDCLNFSHREREQMDFLPAAKSANDTSIYRIYADSPTHFSDVKKGDAIVLCNLKAKKQTGDIYPYARETLIRESKYEPTQENDEVSCIVGKVDIGETSYIEYTAYNAEGSVVEPKGYVDYTAVNDQRRTDHNHVGPIYRRAMPVINSVCVHNNRLWGTNPNGEYVYASKLGDFREFNKFLSVASDSFYMSFGSSGRFEGLVSYRNYVMAFKEDCIHIISGSSPNSFALSRTVEGIGCIDIRSCAQAGGCLYFLARDGFYRFDGVSFENLSKKLGKSYAYAVGAAKGNKYFCQATDKDGKRELLVFDASYGLWHTLSFDKEIKDMFYFEGELYGATNDAIYLFESSVCKEWKVESCYFFEEGKESKYPNTLWIRARLEKNKIMRVFSCEEGEEYKEHSPCKGTGKTQTYSVPIRWKNEKSYKIKLEGNGKAVIYFIETENASGGKRYTAIERNETK